MTRPEWSARIRRLMLRRGDNQEAFAKLLGVSAATLSRWVNGKNEPSPEMYVALGNLAGEADGGYFWERAGVVTAPAELTRRQLVSTAVNAGDLEQIRNSSISAQLAPGDRVISVPLLDVPVFADEEAPIASSSLAEAKVETVLTAPSEWCPHPDKMLALRVRGNSMTPLVPAGAIVMVDTAVSELDKLDRKIVVVSHRDLGYKLARLQKIVDTWLLISANHRCLPVEIRGVQQWKVLGEVLWWISHDDFPKA